MYYIELYIAPNLVRNTEFENLNHEQHNEDVELLG